MNKTDRNNVFEVGGYDEEELDMERFLNCIT